MPTADPPASGGRRLRLSLSVKFTLLSALVILLVAGAISYLLLVRFGQVREREIFERDRQLARLLAGLRQSSGQLDFPTVASFVEAAGRIRIGLVYAIHLDLAERMIGGALDETQFGRLDAGYRRSLAAGERRVLERLAAGKIDRRDRIKEYTLPVPRGSLRLGFNLKRIDEQIERQSGVALLILGGGLVLGLLGSILLARQMSRPIRRLAGAMEAVAGGDLQQTVRVTTRDELASLAESFNRMMRALREQRQLEQMVTPYLSAEVLARLGREAVALEMVLEERLATILAVALGRVQGLDPRARVSAVNDYLAPMIDAVREQGGVVLGLDDRGFVAAWGVPEDLVEPERAALSAGLALQRAVADEARRQSVAGVPSLAVGVGIATGRVVAGNLGSVHRVTYTVIGEAVEVARASARLALPGQVLAAETTASKVRDQAGLRAGPPLILEGQDEAIPLYQVSDIG
jgi:adenylate cyclase